MRYRISGWNDVAIRVSRGALLSECLVGLWPEAFVSAVAAGDHSGKLTDALKQVEFMLLKKQIKKDALSQLYVPMAYIAGCLVAIISLNPHTSHAAEQEVILDSNIQITEYTASVSGSVGCKAPVDLNHPKNGECLVKRSKFETGWKLTKVGNSCYIDAIKLIYILKMKQSGTDNMDIEAPSIGNHLFTVKCPISQEIDIMQSPLHVQNLPK